jgi:dTDP-4-dehydrorhamnose 3,5-epimerase
MHFEATHLPEVVLITPHTFHDERGYFFESWHELAFRRARIDARFVQDNHSQSVRHALRGLHYQIQQIQGKLVRVAYGAVFDVAVDVRRSSPTFGQWVGVELSDQNRQMLWIPPGFAHGYLALTERVVALYKCTELYSPEHERSVRFDDPVIGIEWPLPDGVFPLVSPRDANAPTLANAECLA